MKSPHSILRARRAGIAALFGAGAVAAAATGLRADAHGVPASLYQAMRWRMIGPFRGGRTRALAGVHGRPDVLYIGAVNGGVWKSDDYGRTWRPIFDAEPSQSIGAIAVAPSDPRIVYVASGEGLQRPDLSVGNGIYRSTNAGKTWKRFGLRDGEQIPSLAVDPHDPKRVFAAVLGHPYGPNTERGIFRTLDGGRSWQRVLYRGADVGGSQVVIDPSNSQVVYAALWKARQGPWEDDNDVSGSGGGLFKSTDGGATWRELGKGLPGDVVQINIAVAAQDPKRLYAVFSTLTQSRYESGAGMGLYRSDDGGETWAPATLDPRPMMKIGGGDLPVLAVDPANADVLYSTSIVTLRSADGGKTWESLRGAPGGDDYQNIWIDPYDSKTLLLVGDQGAVVSVNGGRSFSSWYNQPTAQLYHVSTDDRFPYRVCGGQQESGSVCISSRGNDGEITVRDWHPVGAIEYGSVAPDPLHADIVYGAGRNRVSKFHWSTGQVQNVTPIPLLKNMRAERTEPIVFSPVDPHVLYYAANMLYETRDGGKSWRVISPDLARPRPGVPASLGTLADGDPKAARHRGAIYALAPSYRSAGTLWAGTDDGFVWSTHDGGKHWKNITPVDLIPWSKVTQIDASRFDDRSVYVSVSRMRIDDLRPYIYRTHDGGRTWRKIVDGLPDDSPVDTVRADPLRQGLLYAGTETGVWVSFDDGGHWQSLQLNLPHTSVRDLIVHGNDLVVATHGRGFWILDDVEPLREIAAGRVTGALHLFTPAAAYRLRRDTNTDTPLPPDEPAGQNPPDGAIIDYVLARSGARSVSLEIFDAHGALVRRYSSADKPEITDAEIAKQLIPGLWVRRFRSLGVAAGMHRWVWDLRYAAPPSIEHSYPIAAVAHATPRLPLGPLAVPGRYTVRLTVDGRSSSAPLVVKMDPRVKVSPGALARQLQLAQRLAAMMAKMAKMAKMATSARMPMQTHSPATALVQRLRHIDGDINGLYADVTGADADPTVAQRNAADELARYVTALQKRWRMLARAAGKLTVRAGPRS